MQLTLFKVVSIGQFIMNSLISTGTFDGLKVPFIDNPYFLLLLQCVFDILTPQSSICNPVSLFSENLEFDILKLFLFALWCTMLSLHPLDPFVQAFQSIISSSLIAIFPMNKPIWSLVKKLLFWQIIARFWSSNSSV